MTTLTQGMYGTRENPTPDAPFGLVCGMLRFDYIVHNAGWYNKAGEKLGFGDLSDLEFDRIAAAIPEDEMFIILTERDSYLNFLSPSDDMPQQKDAPGIDYVLAHCAIVISRGHIYRIDAPQSTTWMEAISRQQVEELIRAA